MSVQQKARVAALFVLWLVHTSAFSEFREKSTQKDEAKKQHQTVLSFSMKIERHPLLPETITILYRSPHQWRRESRSKLPLDGNVQCVVCDGKILWCYSKSDGQVANTEKCDLTSIKKECSEEVLYDYLFSQGYLSVLTLADPQHVSWKKEFAFPRLIDQLKKVNEEKLRARDTLVYEIDTQGVVLRFWFDKEDGLLRRQALLQDGKKDIWDVRDLKKDVSITDGAFKFTPPKGVKVVDRTEEVIREMKEKAARSTEGKGVRKNE